MNAKDELLKLIEGRQILCALITTFDPDEEEDEDIERERRVFELRINHTNEKFLRFLDELNFDYFNGYYTQELFGTVWLKDGTWAVRDQDKATEYWRFVSSPCIPDRLK